MTDMLSNSAQRRAERREHQRFVANCLKAIAIMVILTIGAITLIRVNYIMKVQNDMADMLTQLEINQSIDQDAKAISQVNLEPLGEYTITHYCACEECCGKTDGITKTGTLATEGRTIAVDPSKIELGSTVWIDGHEYVAEDIGGAIKGNRIDIFVDDHQEAVNRGVIKREVYQ